MQTRDWVITFSLLGLTVGVVYLGKQVQDALVTLDRVERSPVGGLLFG